jgi:DNA-directed RNA polymerase subunit M/transcription elongation factor TFIIS
MKFCNCGTLITKKRHVNGLYYDYCSLCKNEITNTDSYDSLLYIDKNKVTKTSINLVKAMIDDPTYQQIKKKCANEKCSNNILRFDYKKSMKRVYVCPKCGFFQE